MTNIKIVRRFARGQYEEGTEPEVYDIYFDVGLFSPLIKKWKIDKSALTREEAIKYIEPWLLDMADNKIFVVVKKKKKTSEIMNENLNFVEILIWRTYGNRL